MSIYIALCGAPNSGKSTVSKILGDQFNVEPIDDAKPIREAAKILFNLTDWHVYTQRGKMTRVKVMDDHVLVRELLGQTGAMLEESHGNDFLPWRALIEAAHIKQAAAGEVENFSFGSVRHEQAWYYKKRGGVCIETIRPGFKPVVSHDQYDDTAADIKIINDGSFEELQAAITHIGHTYMNYIGRNDNPHIIHTSQITSLTAAE